MAEPEDLILEFAHRGVVAAERLWLRYHVDADATSRTLAGLRPHVEFLLAALTDQPVSVRPADSPVPASWVARLARRSPRHLRGLPPSMATGDAEIHLPRIPPVSLVAAGLTPAAVYRLLVAEHVARLERGTPGHAPGDPETSEHLLYELCEAVAAEQWLARTLPGLVPDLTAARRGALADRPGLAELRPVERAIEQMVQRVLAAPPTAAVSDVPLAATPAEARAWAFAKCALLPGEGGSCRGLPAVPQWGRVLVVSAPAELPLRGEPGPSAAPSPGRTHSLRRSPRPREAQPGEDDHSMGMWIIRPDEPQESVEDPMGLERPADRDAEAAPEELADALADIPETRVVATPNAPREVLTSEGPVPRAKRPTTTEASRIGLVYPEWDCWAQAYRLQGAVVREEPIATGDGVWAKAALERHSSLVRRVRRQFARLRPWRSREHGQPDGTELDLEALVGAYADRRAGVAQAGGEDRFYIAERAARRSLAIAVLIDVSASTDSWLAGTRRVIDVEKEALLVVGEALEWLGDRHAMYAFSGEGPAGVQVQVVKAFSDRGGALVQRRIERLEPDRYTRVGAALRHATARLAMEPAERRLLLLLTDGRPNDVDQYEGRYGVEDTRQAVREAACEGVLVFGLTVDRAAPAYLTTLFGPGRAALLRSPERLPGALVEVLRRLVAAKATL